MASGWYSLKLSFLDGQLRFQVVQVVLASCASAFWKSSPVEAVARTARTARTAWEAEQVTKEVAQVEEKKKHVVTKAGHSCGSFLGWLWRCCSDCSWNRMSCGSLGSVVRLKMRHRTALGQFIQQYAPQFPPYGASERPIHFVKMKHTYTQTYESF